MALLSRSVPSLCALPAWLMPAALAVLPPVVPAHAGPVLCTTTLEAPAQGSASGPIQVTRCDAVQTAPELVDSRFFTWTAPFAEGVSIRGQLRELGGVATGSINRGDAIRAFGFPDQTIIWDGTALQNTLNVMLEAQSDLQPWRTADIPNGFGCSLGSPTGCQNLGNASTRRASDGLRGLW